MHDHRLETKLEIVDSCVLASNSCLGVAAVYVPQIHTSVFVRKNAAYAFESEMDATLHIRIACVQCVGNTYEVQPSQMFCFGLGVRECRNVPETSVLPGNDCKHTSTRPLTCVCAFFGQVVFPVVSRFAQNMQPYRPGRCASSRLSRVTTGTRCASRSEVVLVVRWRPRHSPIM